MTFVRERTAVATPAAAVTMAVAASVLAAIGPLRAMSERANSSHYAVRTP